MADERVPPTDVADALTLADQYRTAYAGSIRQPAFVRALLALAEQVAEAGRERDALRVAFLAMIQEDARCRSDGRCVNVPADRCSCRLEMQSRVAAAKSMRAEDDAARLPSEVRCVDCGAPVRVPYFDEDDDDGEFPRCRLHGDAAGKQARAATAAPAAREVPRV